MDIANNIGIMALIIIYIVAGIVFWFFNIMGMSGPQGPDEDEGITATIRFWLIAIIFLPHSIILLILAIITWLIDTIKGGF